MHVIELHPSLPISPPVVHIVTRYHLLSNMKYYAHQLEILYFSWDFLSRKLFPGFALEHGKAIDMDNEDFTA